MQRKSLLFALACAVAGTTDGATHNHSSRVVLAPGYADLEFIPPRAGSYDLPSLGIAPDGAVLLADGHARRLHDLIGEKLTVLSFIYVSCTDVNGCPLATYVLRGVADRLKNEPDLRDQVRLLSMSFDPQHDTPAVMSAYGAKFAGPAIDWQFLTSEGAAQLDPILAAYDQWVQKDYAADGRYLGSVSHVLRVFLIDRQRRIRNIYSMSFLHADTVVNDIRTVLADQQNERGHP